MRKVIVLLVGAALLTSVGCGGLSDKDKGKNSNLDRPKPAGKE